LEVSDGAEAVEWLSTQEWCTGKVGLGGVSYPGAIQLLIAARRPAGLVCIAPGVAPIDFYRDWTHRGGIPSHTNWAALTFLQTPQNQDSATAALKFYYGTAQGLAEDGPAFAERSPITVIDQIEVPILFMGGLYDYFSRGTLRGFDAATAPKRLVFGPWGHQYPEDTHELVSWYKYWLLGEGEDPTVGENVHFWRLGAKTWTQSEGRVVPDRPTTVSIGETLIPVRATQGGWPPVTTAPPVPVLMDTSTHSGMHLWGEDIAVALGHVPGEIEGAPILHLSLTAKECTDADLFVRLNMLHADGTVEQLTEGRLRLSHRAIDNEKSRRYGDGSYESVHLTHTGPEPLPNSAEDVYLEMLPTSVVLPADASLQLGISACRVDGVSLPGEILAHGLHLHLPIHPTA
jgi:predicted acyl esterase